jgi:FlaA1/EpsC-like NDP-sugar epimerase
MVTSSRDAQETGGSFGTGDHMNDDNKVFVRKTSQILIDLAIFVLSFSASFFIRFEGLPDPVNFKQLLIFFPFIVLARFISFQLFSIYSVAWRYISILDVISVLKGCLPVSSLLIIGRFFLPARLGLFRIPTSVIALEFMLVLLGTLSTRMVRRLLYEQSERALFKDKGVYLKKKRVILIGAGSAGNMIMKELRQRPDLGMDVIGFVDDDPGKRQTMVQGTKVLDNTIRIPDLVRRLSIEEAIITIANASSQDIRRIVDICKGTQIKVKIIPGLFEMLDDNVKVTKIREVNIDDLLGRSVVNFESYLPEIIQHYRGQRILVTGAGGSIGSELCRQLSTFSPKELILLDKDENSIYEIDYELRQNHPIKISPLIADIRNVSRLNNIFDKYRPGLIFHAAAHKHVPLMEFNIPEAIMNNVAGTQNLAELANRWHVKSLVYISTDKAVNPTSVMGATKKIGEIIIQEIASQSSTRFSCVRFGNVLGSRGSVVPLFQKQIAAGGPITITHPNMTRYFMSIAEAVQLIIQAGTIGHKGEIFVLNMGQPIKILELAKDLIKLSGYSEADFKIQFIGQRPGEKLFEEILIGEERTKVTHFRKILISPPIEINRAEFVKHLSALFKAAEAGESQRILEVLKAMRIGYKEESQEKPLTSRFVN